MVRKLRNRVARLGGPDVLQFAIRPFNRVRCKLDTGNRGIGDGVSNLGAERAARVAAVPRQHDVWRCHRRTHRGADRGAGARAGRQLHRYRRWLQCRPVGGDRRPGDPRAPVLVGAGHQVRQPDRTGAKCARGLAPARVRCGRSQPAPAGRGCDRRALPAQGGSCDASGRDGAGTRRPDPWRQDPLFRRIKLPVMAGGGDLPSVRRGWDRPASGEPAAVQPAEPRGGGRTLAGLRLFRVGCCAVQPVGTRGADREVPAERGAAAGQPSGAA